MKDWNEPRDTGPQIEEPRYRHVKSRKGNKPFAIEVRYIGKSYKYANNSIYNLFESLREWHTYRRYKTEKQRDQAFATLEHKKRVATYPFTKNYEYRIEQNKER